MLVGLTPYRQTLKEVIPTCSFDKEPEFIIFTFVKLDISNKSQDCQKISHLKGIFHMIQVIKCMIYKCKLTHQRCVSYACACVKLQPTDKSMTS